MAMNKKEQAELAALKKQIALAMALRWTDPVKPDVPPPSGSVRYSYGWLTGGAYEHSTQAWSSSVTHGRSAPEKAGRNGSQNCRHLYSTRLLALRARRHEMECDFAKQLADVDAEISKELAVMSAPKEQKGE